VTNGVFPRVAEQYRTWRPPIDLVPVVERLLSSVPARYLAGLATVVLGDAAGMGRQSRRAKTKRRGRKIKVRECLGFYHAAVPGRGAWIEILADNVFGAEANVPWRIPPVRDLGLGSVLFHELGHHIHKTCAPEHREREDVADSWGIRLGATYFRRRYWYLVPVTSLFVGFRKILRRLRQPNPR
jgi:hypothetical protein